MLALKINGQIADSSPNLSINFLVNAKFWELNQMEGNRSFTFKLPATKKNQQIFNFPEVVANTNTQLFQKLPAQIFYNNQFLYTGFVKLSSANQYYYEVAFFFGAADLADFKNTSIRELLKEEIHLLDNSNPNTLTQMSEIDSLFVMPTCKFNNYIFNRFNGLVYVTEADLQEGTFVVFVKLHHILSLIIKNTNYKLLNPDWYLTFPDIKKITVWNNRELDVSVVTNVVTDVISGGGAFGNWGFPNNSLEIQSLDLPPHIRIAEIVPNITLSEFISTVRKLFGLYFEFDNLLKTIKIHFFKDLFNQNEYKDFTNQARPLPTNKGNNFEGVKFDFKKDPKDNFLKNQKEPDPTLQKLASADTLGDLPVFAPYEQPSTYRFYLKENQYYYAEKTAFGDVRRYYLADFLPFSQGNNPEKNEIPCCPVRASRILEFELQPPFAQARNNGSGKVRLYHNNSRLVGKPGYIHLKEAKHIPTDSIFAPTADNANYIDISANFVEQEDGVKWSRFWITNAPILDTASPMTRKLLSQDNPDFAFRIFFFHGLQQKKDSLEVYPYASADNLNPKGEQIAEFSLRLEENGIIEQFYAEYINFMTFSNLYEFEINFSIKDLINLKPYDVIRIRETNFYIEAIDVTLSSKGISPAKVLLRKAVVKSQASTNCFKTITTSYQLDCECVKNIITKYQTDCE